MCTGKLTIHEKEGNLELEGFLLQIDDRIEIRVLGFWLFGKIAHDKRGWYLQTQDKVGIRLQSGLVARALSLASVAS